MQIESLFKQRSKKQGSKGEKTRRQKQVKKKKSQKKTKGIAASEITPVGAEKIFSEGFCFIFLKYITGVFNLKIYFGILLLEYNLMT